MANPYSTLHNYDTPLFNHDFEAIQAALNYKQGNLDQNRNKLQLAIDTYASNDIYKSVDKEYFDERLNSIIDTTNQYAGMDLSDAGLANSLLQNTRQVMDSNVENAIISTKIFRSEQDEWESKRKTGDAKYSVDNHNYALQASQNWRTSDKVGDRYNGGGDFIEYVDVGAHVSKELTSKLKEIEDEYLRTVQGAGGFDVDLKYREVSKQKVEAAIDSLLGPKEAKQMKINAWAQYGQLPDEDVKAAYDGYMQPKIDFTTDYLETQKAILNTTQEPAARKLIQDKIDAGQANLENLQGVEYEDIGKEVAYTRLYTHEFKSNFIDAYAKEPQVIEQKVNALSEALNEQRNNDRTYGLAVENANTNKERAAEAKRHNLATEAKDGTGTPKVSKDGISALPGDKDPFSFLDNKDPHANPIKDDDWLRASKETANEGMKNVFSGYINSGKLKESDLKNHRGLVEAIRAGSQGQDQTEVDVNGERIVINWANPEVEKNLSRYMGVIFKKPAFEQDAMTAMQGMQQKVQDNLKTVLQGNGDISERAIPNFAFRLEGSDSKGYTSKLNTKEGSNYYLWLLKQEKLDATQQKNLDMYTQMHIAMDPKTSKQTADIIYQNVNKTIFSKVKNGREILPNSNADMRASFRYTKRDSSTRLVDNERTMEARLGVDKLLGSDKGVGVANVFRDAAYLDKYALSRQTGMDTEYYDKSGNEVSLQGFNEMIPTISKYNDDAIKLGVEKADLNPTKKELFFTKEKQAGTYGELEKHLGTLPKGAIVSIVPEVNTKGVPTGNADVSYTYIEKKDGKQIPNKVSSNPLIDISEDVTRPAKLTERDLQQLGIDLDKTGRSFYNAGVTAQKISLGNGSIGLMEKADLKNGTLRGERLERKMIKEQIPLGGREARLIVKYPKHKELIEKEFANLESGKYTFALEGDKINGWYQTMDIGDGEPKKVPLGIMEMTDEAVYDMKMHSQVYNQEFFYHQYLEPMIIK